MDISNLSLIVLDKDTTIKPFDCDDQDLNDFLINDAKNYSKEQLATTFLLEEQNLTIAYYSILNDSLHVVERKFISISAFKRFLKSLLPHRKRHLRDLPAIKIGRLAINKNTQKRGLGTKIIFNIIDYAINVNSKCACKLIAVDAYSKSVEFYEKMGFEYLTDGDKGKSERQMFLNLTPIIRAMN